MRKIVLLLIACVSVLSHAKDPDYNSDLNSIKSPKIETKSKTLQKKERSFEQRFNEDYAGFYTLNPSKTCTLSSNVKKVKLDLKENDGNPSVRAILYGENNQILDNKFYPLATAKVSPLNPPSKDETSLLWDSAISKDGKKNTKYERISFAKDILSFDVDRWVGGETFFDKLLTSNQLVKSSKCNFTKVDVQTLFQSRPLSPAGKTAPDGAH